MAEQAVQSPFEKFNQKLADSLRRPYTPPSISGGHDFSHPDRMAKLGPKIKKVTGLDFDLGEFVAAVWLHNLDRTFALRDEIRQRGAAWAQKCSELLPDGPIHDEEDVKEFVRVRGIEIYCRELLAAGPFNQDACDRIVDAVLQHSKKDDGPNDSSLLTALRIADKIDRLGAVGILAIAAHSGARLLPYDPAHPFGCSSTAENKLRSIYDDLIRVLEWYGMLPSDKSRALVDMKHLCVFIEFLRALGEEIAEATGEENRVERDIRNALGPYYHPTLGVGNSPELIDIYDLLPTV